MAHHDRALLLSQRPSGDLGQGNGETTLAEPSTPNRNPARGVAEQLVPDRKVNNPVGWLLCPVRLGRPGRYSKVKYKCREGVKYKGLSKLK